MSKGNEYSDCVDLGELDVVVTYDYIAGTPATQTDPADGPEVQITSVDLTFGEESFTLTSKSTGIEGILFTLISDDQSLVESIIEDHDDADGDED